MELTEES
jgi:hypothetical protein